MKRPPFQQRTFRLVDREIVRRMVALIENLPVDAARPLEVVIREEKRKRSLDQNSLYWAGPLRDIAEQAWVQGRQYSSEVWHEHFKREFLPRTLTALIAICHTSRMGSGSGRPRRTAFVFWSAARPA